jgi:hypothetical protein
MTRTPFLGPACLCLLLFGVSAAEAKPQIITVVYRGSAEPTPASLPFQIGDRLVLRVEPKELQKKLTGRSVRVDGKIKYVERIDVEKHKVSCGLLGLGSCIEEKHIKIYAEQGVWNTTTTQYEPFLQVGPVLRLSTPAGDKNFPLQGEDAKAREVLSAGGYTYVALQSGELHFGRLVLPTNSFDLGSSEATPEEVAAGQAWVASKCDDKNDKECVVNGEPSFTVTRGTVELQLKVELDHPQQAAPTP